MTMAGIWAFDNVSAVRIDLADQVQTLCCFKDNAGNEQLQFVKIPRSFGDVTEDVWDEIMREVLDKINNPPEMEEVAG